MTIVRRARVLLADPPWKHDDALGKRGAAANYPVLSTRELARFPLPPLADDCLLLLWRLSNMQAEALYVVDAWGFTVKSEIVWEKLTATGKPWFGLGRYVRASHETCLVATRGRVQVNDRSIRSRFAAPVQEHSRKPDQMYEIAEALSDGPYTELFARRARRGWRCLGNEVRRPGRPLDDRQLALPYTEAAE